VEYTCEGEGVLPVYFDRESALVCALHHGIVESGSYITLRITPGFITAFAAGLVSIHPPQKHKTAAKEHGHSAEPGGSKRTALPRRRHPVRASARAIAIT
jgi:hypothetical protein